VLSTSFDGLTFRRDRRFGQVPRRNLDHPQRRRARLVRWTGPTRAAPARSRRSTSPAEPAARGTAGIACRWESVPMRPPAIDGGCGRIDLLDCAASQGLLAGAPRSSWRLRTRSWWGYAYRTVFAVQGGCCHAGAHLREPVRP
jgi:hypothetical protein